MLHLFVDMKSDNNSQKREHLNTAKQSWRGNVGWSILGSYMRGRLHTGSFFLDVFLSFKTKIDTFNTAFMHLCVKSIFSSSAESSLLHVGP